MDPLSISAAILSVAKSVSTICKAVQWINSLKHVPLELSDLNNELETIRGYLSIIRPILDRAGCNQAITPSLTTYIEVTLQKLESDLQRLEGILDGFVRPFSTSTLQKINWKRKKDLITSNRDRVRQRKIELGQALALLNYEQSQSNTILLLATQQIQFAGIQAQIGNSLASKESLLSQPDSRAVQVSNALPLGKPLMGASTFLDHQPIANVQNSPGARQFEGPRESLPLPLASGYRYLNVVSKVRHRCRAGCSCQCHTRREIHFHNIKAFSDILGAFFLSYSSLPVWDPRPCNYSGCENARTDSIELNYMFPKWLARKALMFSASWQALSLSSQGATINLRLPRVLPRNHRVWEVIHTGNLPILQSMLQHKEIVPSDVNEGGESLFQHALLFMRAHVTPIQNFLLPYAGDLLAKNHYGISPWALSRLVILTRRAVHPERLQIYHKVLEICDETDERSTQIHEAIHANSDMSLVDAIRQKPRLINSTDSLGLTPLHWAVEGVDMENIRILIAWGADLNGLDSLGYSPLLHAIIAGRYENTALLLDAGADVNLSTKIGRPLLLKVAQKSDPADYTALLLKHGADPKVTDDSGRTALHHLLYRPNPSNVSTVKTIDLLLEAGLGIDERDSAGVSPLMFATQGNNDFVIRILLERGADCCLKDAMDMSILHYLAKYATLTTIEAFEGRLSKVDPKWVSKEGMTAEEYFKERSLTPPKPVSDLAAASTEDICAFEKLMTGIKDAQNKEYTDSSRKPPMDGGVGITTAHDEEEENNFHDAVEFL